LTRSSPQEITQLLLAWYGGDRSALDRLVPLVYEKLRKQAHLYMAHERRSHILQTTALVHEAYLQLQNAGQVSWQDRRHFYAIAARVMRQILVHAARSRRSLKRGGGYLQVSLSEAVPLTAEPAADVIKLDDALKGLEKIDPRKARVVELRFFGGLSLEETAEILKVSADTVSRDWDIARAWLWREMRNGTGQSNS